MNRRDFTVGSASMLAGIGLLGARLRASGPADDWSKDFAAARARDPSLRGYESARLQGYGDDALAIEGRLPADLSGTLLRTGPARHEIGGARYHHWFDGDGMIQRFRFHDGKVSHLGRYVETPKFIEESAAGIMLEGAFGTVPETSHPASSPDAVNTANINVIFHGGRAMALWEAGSATEIDPETLATKGFVRWSEQSAGLPFGAHPKWDADGSLWNVGCLAGTGKLFLYHIGADGTLLSLDILPVPRNAGMIHDFVLSERHLVIPLSSLAVEMGHLLGRFALVDAMTLRQDQPFHFLIISKADRTVIKTAELASGFIYHFGNGWEDASGVIRVDAYWYDDFSLTSDSLRYVMRGEHRPSRSAKAVLLSFDTMTGRASREEFGHYAEFPRFDGRFATQRTRAMFQLGFPEIFQTEQEQARYSILRQDRETGRQDLYLYEAGIMPEEHIFVPKPGAKGGGEAVGWIVGTSLDWKKGLTRLAVFDAQHLADGPVALATLPYALPLGLHGNWSV